MENVETLINQGLQVLANLEVLYREADTKRKRQIIGSIYPEKLVFDGFHYRTARLNEAVALIYKLGAGFSGNEKGEIDPKINFSFLVDPYGFEP